MSTWYESTEKEPKVSPTNTMTTRTMRNTVSTIARTILIYYKNVTGMQHISRSGTEKRRHTEQTSWEKKEHVINCSFG
jgi:hypothetical protein